MEDGPAGVCRCRSTTPTISARIVGPMSCLYRAPRVPVRSRYTARSRSWEVLIWQLLAFSVILNVHDVPRHLYCQDNKQ